MDPDETLYQVRAHIRQMGVEDKRSPEYAQHAADLAELVKALDEWLTHDGFYPWAWTH